MRQDRVRWLAMAAGALMVVATALALLRLVETHPPTDQQVSPPAPASTEVATAIARGRAHSNDAEATATPPYASDTNADSASVVQGDAQTQRQGTPTRAAAVEAPSTNMPSPAATPIPEEPTASATVVATPAPVAPTSTPGPPRAGTTTPPQRPTAIPTSTPEPTSTATATAEPTREPSAGALLGEIFSSPFGEGFCRLINLDTVCWGSGDPIPVVDPEPRRGAPGRSRPPRDALSPR